jgi:hypothetical protein
MALAINPLKPRNIVIALVACLTLFACAEPPGEVAPEAAAEAAQTTPVYGRYAELSANPIVRAKLAAPAARIADFAWMLGDWDMTAIVYGANAEEEVSDPERATFRMQGDALIVDDKLSMILGFDGFTERWFTAGFEPPAAPMTQAYSTADWNGAQLVFESDVRILGERYILRQTLVKTGDDSFELRNAQQIGPGIYRDVDLYRYQRVQLRSRRTRR